MPNVRYTISAAKTYSYEGDVLIDTPMSLSFSFTADILDPYKDGLIPYYKSDVAEDDSFFQDLMERGFEFSKASTPNLMGTSLDSQYSSWTEVYTFKKNKGEFHDVQISMSLPCWRLKMIDMVNYEQYGESKRMRQAYGYQPITGGLSGRLKKDPGDWRTWFQYYDPEKLIVDSITKSESYENGEKIWYISLSWKSYDLNYIPSLKEIW